MPTLFELDRTGVVIFVSTFSKIFSPGLRVGWVAARGEVLQKYVLAKQGADLHTSTLAQLLVATFLDRFDLEAHIARVRQTCRVRRDTMLHEIAARLPDVTVTHPLSGLFLWLELPPAFGVHEWLRRSLARRVAFPPGTGFFPNGGGEHAARLCFSDSPEPRIARRRRAHGGGFRRHAGRRGGDRMSPSRSIMAFGPAPDREGRVPCALPVSPGGESS